MKADTDGDGYNDKEDLNPCIFELYNDLLNGFTDNQIKKLDIAVCKNIEGLKNYIKRKNRYDDEKNEVLNSNKGLHTLEKIHTYISTGTANFNSDDWTDITINSHYNTSADEFLLELGSLIPKITIIISILKIQDDTENLDWSGFKDAVIAAVTDKDVAALTPYENELKGLSEIVKYMTIVDGIETIVNWNDESKQQTNIILWTKGQIYSNSSNEYYFLYNSMIDEYSIPHEQCCDGDWYIWDPPKGVSIKESF